MRKLAAEFIGTFCIVFAGTGAIVSNERTGLVTHVGVALCFGLVVMTMIYALGEISGAHFNPAVTLGFWAARRLEARWILPYSAAQVGGALVASLALRLMFPMQRGLGATLPSTGVGAAFVLEIILTWILMLVILRVSQGAKEKGITAAIAIGGVVAFEALFAGPLSGASMNPARSLAPALIGGQLDSLWVYLTAPFLGALAAAATEWVWREPEKPTAKGV